MKHIISILTVLLFMCNLSAQEIIQIDTAQYLVTYTPLPEAIQKTENAIAGIDRQIQKTQQQIEKEVKDLQALQTKKIELETALKIMQNPPPTKSVSTKSAALPEPAPPAKKGKEKKAKTPSPKKHKAPGPIKNE